LFDASGNDTIVVIRAIDFQRVLRLLDDDELELGLNNELDERWQALIDKKYSQSLNEPECMELALLQPQAERHLDQVASPDLAGATAVYQELLNRLGG
jgi:hypothetical protein